MIVGYGIAIDAVTYGYSYAPIPVLFITLPLLSAIGCFLWTSGLDKNLLAAIIVLYFVAVVRGVHIGQQLVRSDNRLKNEATLLSNSLETANDKAMAFAS